MKALILSIVDLFHMLSSFCWCIISGIGFDSSWRVDGKIIVVRNRLLNLYKGRPCGKLVIGKKFSYHYTFSTNPIGLI